MLTASPAAAVSPAMGPKGDCPLSGMNQGEAAVQEADELKTARDAIAKIEFARRLIRVNQSAKLIVWTAPVYFLLTNTFKFGAVDLAYFVIFASACVYLTARHFKRFRSGFLLVRTDNSSNLSYVGGHHFESMADDTR